MEGIVSALLENHYFSKDFLTQLIQINAQGEVLVQNKTKWQQYTSFLHWTASRLLKQVGINKEWIPLPRDETQLEPKVVLIADPSDIKTVIEKTIHNVPRKQINRLVNKYSGPLSPLEGTQFLHNLISIILGTEAYSLFTQSYERIHKSSFARDLTP